MHKASELVKTARKGFLRNLFHTEVKTDPNGMMHMDPADAVALGKRNNMIANLKTAGKIGAASTVVGGAGYGLHHMAKKANPQK